MIDNAETRDQTAYAQAPAEVWSALYVLYDDDDTPLADVLLAVHWVDDDAAEHVGLPAVRWTDSR